MLSKMDVCENTAMNLRKNQAHLLLLAQALHCFVLPTSLTYISHKSLNLTASCFNHKQQLTTRNNNKNVQYNLLCFLILCTQNTP